MTAPPESPVDADPWSLRWAHLARAVGLGPGARVVVALSGGADSVLLLHLLADSGQAAGLRAVHVDHGLRGTESERDRAFCERLCERLGVPLSVREVALDARDADLERRAREARYRALLAEARRTGHEAIATGHHADDQVETLLLRWMRGSTLGGLRGARARTQVPGEWPGQPPEQRPPGLAPVALLRPLLPLRRDEIRSLLSARGLRWIEDTSNADPRFARNRVRHHLLPALERSVGPEASAGLDAFARSVERLEDDLARRTAHLAWRPARFARATRGTGGALLGGVLTRSELMALPRPLARRALWRLLTEATGRAPSRAVLEAVLADLHAGRCGRHTLTDGWTLQLRAGELLVLPPSAELCAAPARTDAAQLLLPFSAGVDAQVAADGDWRGELPLEGAIELPDGRRISARTCDAGPSAPVPRAPHRAQLDLERLPPASRLWVRWPRPGDRFHPLGAPGSKPLRRFLADAGVPREERARIALVGAGDRILWVAGLRPSESARVDRRTRRRLQLDLAG